ncbi:hypothetical protein SSBR45G_72160 [Bradyrhizobium sp. SSBR45G]|uniref:DUF2867 domain-containing protein n=1 Tax=unclassified Bradyrhizobium TaxID=2631580 RepID=UPI002342A739|nr:MULTISPECIES: DUF2867 domain-containing protein [unclassified Bradyrhizobium]GLH82307.1 hypothetical protein SSBR45G_72160 [Bradyrhizobium sp. SSBR45G]GLH89713.1 hypothetical protein SSBR45R_71740 [Bradyrhizobium sp. SSBR45R]
MTVIEIRPEVDRARWLAEANFTDAFRITIEGDAITARVAAERMLGHAPRWMDVLVTLRNVLVKPFGLKASGADERSPRPMIGIFPVVDETPQRIVIGFDDKHLDFRVVIDAAPAATALGSGSRMTATTLVQTHNALGRCYLAAIMPFHRLVVRTMLSQVMAPA